MFFSENELSLELLGIFKLKRGEMVLKSNSVRNYDSISLRLRGRGYFKTENDRISVKRGDLLYIPKNAQYSQKTSGESVIAIHFINYTYNKNSKIEKLTVENGDYAEEIVQKMYDVWKEKKQGYRYKCMSLLYELLYFLNRQEEKKKIDRLSHDLRIKKAVDYIHGNFRAEQIDVSFLAEMCAVSETYFRKLFKRIYSVSPKQYIINLRLETAVQLLQSQLYSVNEVSEKSGFTDSKYFAKLFKKRYGHTPREYGNLIPEKIWK